MITLEKACEAYSAYEEFPIESITENDDEWAFFPATDGGFYGAYIPVVNKKTGELNIGNMFDYDELPHVEIPAAYVKDPPPLRYAHPFDDLFGHGFYEKYLKEQLGE